MSKALETILNKIRNEFEYTLEDAAIEYIQTRNLHLTIANLLNDILSEEDLILVGSEVQGNYFVFNNKKISLKPLIEELKKEVTKELRKIIKEFPDGIR